MAAPAQTRTEAVKWTKCPSCGAFVYHKRLQRNLGVCPECNYHFRLPVRERLAILLDEGSFEELGADIEPVDALGFADTKPYVDRIAEAQRKTGNREGALYGTAAIGGNPLVVAAMDFSFIGGSLSGGVGEAITRAAELALERRLPLLVICASGGARMQEGAISLMQMAKTSQAVARLHEAGLLYMTLLTDPTYGGVSASFASLGDSRSPSPAAGSASPARRSSSRRSASSSPTASRRRSSCSTTGSSTSSSRGRTSASRSARLLDAPLVGRPGRRRPAPGDGGAGAGDRSG